MSSISPLAPSTFPSLATIEGATCATAACGIKYKDRVDVLVVECTPGTVVAGTFTKSKTASANILWGKKILSHGKGRVLVVNSGNANAFNGKAGEESVERIVAHCASLWGCDEKEIYPCATGVIGEPLPDTRITETLNSIKSRLTPGNWEGAARAIMTTDTYPKGAGGTCEVNGRTIKMSGIAKGSGMIAPDMATMLGYIFTDLAISPSALQEIVATGVEQSFNAITVDSDTSTSDTLLVFATGKAGNTEITSSDDPALEPFKKLLNNVMLDLAHQIVKDGEGATKFVTITVTGAENDKAAKTIALAIANSPLVKTAIAGEDANWGRIVMAVGKAGEQANRDKMEVRVGGISIAKDGQLNPAYVEADVTRHMQGQNIDIWVDVGVAANDGEATVWTCDLTHNYITINADYRS